MQRRRRISAKSHKRHQQKRIHFLHMRQDQTNRIRRGNTLSRARVDEIGWGIFIHGLHLGRDFRGKDPAVEKVEGVSDGDVEEYEGVGTVFGDGRREVIAGVNVELRK
jgi:hypothetical protein